MRRPSGRRWSAPVSLHVNAAPRCSSLTPSKVLTSPSSHIDEGPTFESPPRSSGLTSNTRTKHTGQVSACSINQKHTSVSVFDLSTFSWAAGCSSDKPSGSRRDLRGGWPGLEEWRTRDHVLAEGARCTPEKNPARMRSRVLSTSKKSRVGATRSANPAAVS